VNRSGNRRLSPTGKRHSALSHFPQKKEVKDLDVVLLEKPRVILAEGSRQGHFFGFAFFTADEQGKS
jgi:hypothetical protein